MKIISHRGYWSNLVGKNTDKAFLRSFQLGYGTETDIRDLHGELVISHDMPLGSEMRFEEFLHLTIASKAKYPLTLALNIKADGLSKAISSAIKCYPQLDFFAFDMSTTDIRAYLDAGIPIFTRMSEVEQQPIWLERASGIWLDSFDSDWFDVAVIQRLLNSGKRVCIVSPELHQRPNEILWQRIKPLANERELMLCTDFPEKATEFFTF